MKFYCRLFFIMLFFGLSVSQSFPKPDIHPSRVILKWKGGQLKSIGASNVNILEFNSTKKADEFFQNNKDIIDYFIFDRKMKLDTSRRDDFMSIQWYLNSIKIDRAWTYSSGRSDVLVAIIDSGYDFNNLDIKKNIYANKIDRRDGMDNDMNMAVDDLNGYNFGYICCDNITLCFKNCLCRADSYLKGRPNDTNGHGTSIAGIIGAGKNNGGIIGIAPYIKILPIKITDCFGDIWTSSVVSAVEYAIKMKANIISCSFGDIYPYQYNPKTLAPDSYKNIIKMYKDIFTKARDANIIVVASAGNDNLDLDNLYLLGYPYSPCLIGRYVDNILCVGSSGKSGSISEFSNYGNLSVHTWAPGEEIFTTALNNQYETVQGTSYSAPIISGIIALAISYLRKKNRSITPAIIKSMIQNSTKFFIDANEFMRRISLF